jgi:predicted dehydrogenase
MSDVNIALIGAGFMGKAHSNAWRQVSAFCAPRFTPRAGGGPGQAGDPKRAHREDPSLPRRLPAGLDHRLLKAVADVKMPSPNFTDGVRNQRVLEAIERSARTRKWVSVKGVV